MSTSNTRRMNVIHVMADQHHAGLMSCASHPQVKTPNLDVFAAGSLPAMINCVLQALA